MIKRFHLNKRSNITKYYNWLMGADMYLASAIILCNKMLESYVSPINSLNDDQRIDKECGFTSANPDYEMLMPVIFNLKHGIELYLKALIMQINPKLEYPISHDLIYLLDTLINILRSENKDDTILNILDRDARIIVEKYYYGLYAFSKDKKMPDVNNEAERFPEYQNPNCYQVKDLYDVVNDNLMRTIKSDCIKFQNILRENIFKKII